MDPGEIALIEEAAERTWAAIEHSRAEADIRASEERYRTLFESMDEAYAVVEVLRDEAGAWADFKFIEVNPAFQAHTNIPWPVGKTATEILGTPNPRWAKLYGQALDSDTPLRIEEAEPTLGRTFDLNIFALDRQRNRVAVLFTNITERLAAEAALRESEDRLQRFGEASQDILWIRDADTRQWLYLTPAFETIYGLSREQAMAPDNYRTWLDLIVPEDRERAEHMIGRVREGERVAFDYRITRPRDGAIRWLRDTDFPITNAAGEITMIGGIGHDFTELRESGERARLLLEELQHRVRNILAMIRSMVRQSIHGYDGLEEFAAHLVGRLDAMARTQVLLTRAAGANVDLESLVRDEFESQLAPDLRVVVKGPKVSLSPKAAEVLTLALHELTTNSVKYGALMDDLGRLAVTWGVAPMNGEEWLQLVWQETALVLQPQPIRKGFGTELIEDRVPYELNGEATLHVTGGGVRAEIAFPLSEGASILETGPVVERGDG